MSGHDIIEQLNQVMLGHDIKQILTAQSDGGGNYHSKVLFIPALLSPLGRRGGDRRAGMNSTEGVIISTTIRLQSSQYLFYIPK